MSQKPNDFPNQFFDRNIYIFKTVNNYIDLNADNGFEQMY